MKSAKGKRYIREMIGVSLIILFTFGSLLFTIRYQRPVNLVRKAIENSQLSIDSITRYERRLSCIKVDLAPEAVVGFISSVDSDQYTEYYLLTQYALSPVIVDMTTDHPTVIGYFPEAGYEDTLQDSGLILIKDCGNGVMLFLQRGLP